MISQKLFHFVSLALLGFLSISNAYTAGLQVDSLDTLVFHHIKTGLMSQNSATQIIEDQYGFLWFGTPNGVYKYDGRDFQVFEKGLDGKIGLTDGYIESMYEDAEGNLYVGTNQGLNIYDRELNIIKPYPFKEPGQLIQSQYIGAIGRSEMFLWLGTSNNGVFRYNPVSGETDQLKFAQIHEDGPSNHFIVELIPLPHGRLLIVTQASVYLISHDLKVIAQIKDPQNISSAIMVESDRFWLASHDGEIIKLSITSEQLLELERVRINEGYSILSLAEDNSGNLWIGTENDGLATYSPLSGIVQHIRSDPRKPNSITSNSIWSIFRAHNGVMWLGPFRQGLSFYDPDYYKFRHIKSNPFNSSSLSNNVVNCFLEDETDNIWIGTDGGGLNYWDRKQNSFLHFSLHNKKLNSNVVLSLFHDNSSKLWIGTWANGLSILDLRNKSYISWNEDNSFLGSNNVLDIIKDNKGRVWIATLFGGVHVYYPESGTHKDIRLQSEIDGFEVITTARLLEDSRGWIWIGTQMSGLFRLVEKEVNSWEIKHYQSLIESSSISNDFIHSIIEDHTGVIWVGTQAGLNRYDLDSESFNSITKTNGLKDDAIKGMISDGEGSLWLSTNKGIINYNPQTGESLDYDLNDGLQGNQFNGAAAYLTRDSEFLFGGSNGFNIFTIDETRKRNDKPKIYISSLKIFNNPIYAGDESGVLKKDISQTDSIILNYDQSVINFEFRALTYRHPEKVNYAYFLDGFEADWNYVGNNPTATYTNLNPGGYNFRIKSTNSDGVWNDQETTLYIQVTPPFWSTWWFRVIIVTVLLSFFYLFYWIRTRSSRNYQAELERLIDERTKELQLQKQKLVEAANELSSKNEEIQRFAFAVSHDLKSPLNGIKGISDLIAMEVDLESPDNKELSQYLSLIRKSCNTMSNLITDISMIARIGMVENKMELLDTHEVVQSAFELVAGRLQEAKVQIKISEDLPAIYGDKNRMVQVFQNLLDNAIKYMGAQAQPMVEIKASENGEVNQFKVIDNGSGLDDLALEKLFSPFQRFDSNVEGTGLGLYMIKYIVESHDGKIHAESEGKGKGATFVVTLPKLH